MRDAKQWMALFTEGVPVPEAVVNRALPMALRQAPELERLTVAAGPEWFDAQARVRHAGRLVDVTLRLAFEDVSVSLDEQRVVLRQIGTPSVAVEGGLIASLVAGAVVRAVLRLGPHAAPRAGRPHVTREGDLYRIDLAPMLPEGWNARLDQPWMKLGKVRAIRCEPGRFRVVLGSTLGGA